MGAGDTVNVKGGVTYAGAAICTGSSAAVVCINTNSGTAGNYITYKAWSGTGIPKIQTSTNEFGIFIRKSYIRISGFDFDGHHLGNASISTNTSAANHNIYDNNVIHDFNGNANWVAALNLSAGGNSKIYNNTLYNNVSFGTIYAQSTDSVRNNIVYHNAHGGICLNGVPDVAYNISFDNGDGLNYNCFDTNADDYSVDPLLNDPTNGDYSLQSTSPAINAGVDLTSSGVTADILSVARPQGSAFDIGSYEYPAIPVTLISTPESLSTNTTPTITGTASTIGSATISSVTYSVDSGSWSSSGITGTDSFTIVVPTLADGEHTIRVRATDSNGYMSDPSKYGTTTFTVDTTAPTSNSISINSGSTYSTSTGVTLTLASIGASQMMISEDSGFSGASWETYSTSKSFTLSTGEGTKTVYAKFKDGVDNTSSSISDTITLDTVNPTLGSFVSPRDYTKDDTKPTLVFKKATDSTSNISSYSVSLDSGKYKSYSISGIPATGDTSKSSYIWKDNSEVKVEFTNESDSDTTNDEIKVYFKGLDSAELTEGKHGWKVTVTDTAGNENSATQDFDLDRTSPSISELAIANVSTVKKGQTYTLSIFKRLPSFSGKIEDSSVGSIKENSDGSKDTFDKVSSGIDNINLTIKRLNKDKKYINHFTKDYSITSNRFYITTPYPLIDGQYEVTISAKDKAGNSTSYPSFYLKIGSSPVFFSVTSFVTDLFNNKPAISPSPTNTPATLNSVTKQPISQDRSFFSWVANLFKSIFHK